MALAYTSMQVLSAWAIVNVPNTPNLSQPLHEKKRITYFCTCLSQLQREKYECETWF